MLRHDNNSANSHQITSTEVAATVVAGLRTCAFNALWVAGAVYARVDAAQLKRLALCAGVRVRAVTLERRAVVVDPVFK